MRDRSLRLSDFLRYLLPTLLVYFFSVVQSPVGGYGWPRRRVKSKVEGRSLNVYTTTTGFMSSSSYTTSCDCNYSPIAPWSYTPQPLTPAPPFQTQLNSRTLQLKILFLKKGEVFKKLYGLDYYHTKRRPKNYSMHAFSNIIKIFSMKLMPISMDPFKSLLLNNYN